MLVFPAPLCLQDKILFTYNGKEAFLNHLRVSSESKTPIPKKSAPPELNPSRKNLHHGGSFRNIIDSKQKRRKAGDSKRSGIWTRGTPGVVTSWTIKKTRSTSASWWFLPTHLKNMRVRQIGSFTTRKTG